jgi:hypothetical protein
MSVYKMVKGFVKEAVKFAKEGAPHVTAKQYEQRLTACFSCPHFKTDVERCGLCGCLVEHKAKWATTSCPDKEEQRWDPVKVGSGGKRIKLKKKNGSKGDTSTAGDKAQPTNTEG